MIKVFRLNDMEWWAGETLEEVKAFCLKETGVSEEEAFEDPYEISEEQMKTLKYYTEEKDDKGEVIVRTFREEIDLMVKEGHTFPCMFACTEF